jgi:hypothetical protein
MRIVFLALPAVMMLSGCGLVGMIASGVSDGTKYVINRVERDPEIQARSQQGYGPAGGDTDQAVQQEQAYPNQNYPAQNYPAQTYPTDPGASQPYPSIQNGGATGAPAPLTAPVQPVTRGEPLN